MKPDWHPRWAGLKAADVVRDVHGRYCSTCERPLPQAAFAWHAGEGALVDGPATEASWPELLVLCHNCAGAAVDWLAKPGDRLALPHRDTTFSLDGPAHFAYVPPAAPGDAASDAATPRAHVLALTPQGAQTVVHFALNTPVRGLHPDAPRQPVAEQAVIDFWDPRLELRTAAWHRAVEVAAVLRQAPEEYRRPLVDQYRVVVEYTGFWSVWATVLAQQLEAPDVTGALLSSEAGPFPGTHDSGLGGR